MNRKHFDQPQGLNYQSKSERISSAKCRSEKADHIDLKQSSKNKTSNTQKKRSSKKDNDLPVKIQPLSLKNQNNHDPTSNSLLNNEKKSKKRTFPSKTEEETFDEVVEGENTEVFLSADISQDLKKPKQSNPLINTNNDSNLPQNSNFNTLNTNNNINASKSNYMYNNIISIPLHPSVTIPPFYTFSYHGIKVKFPYENPYEAQKTLILNSLLAFTRSQNALLESPTGTGKSLALLSSSLSFLEKSPQVSRVFYTSRTHIQLQQLVGEFKKLPYYPRFSILASRRHLCIVPEVFKSNSPDFECKKLCDTNSCPYNKTNNDNKTDFGDIEEVKTDITKVGIAIQKGATPFEFTNQGQMPKFDLEDLKNYGKKFKVCPYQLSRNIYQNSQLVFCPYNYILTPNDDKSLLSDTVKNSAIVIFDEGHNIESTARDDSSISISYRLAFEVKKSLQNAPSNSSHKQLFDEIQIVATDIINFIKSKRKEFDELIDENSDNNGFKKPKYLSGDYIPNVFRQSNSKQIQLHNVGYQMHNFLQFVNAKGQAEKNLYANETLISFCSICSDVFAILNRSSFDSFKIAFVPDETGKKEKDEFRLLCMRPAFLFEKINKHARSVIIASGTLSPLDSFASELEASFPIRVSAPHVVDPSQILTISINSYKNCRITSKFSVLQSHSHEIYSSLSQIVLKTIRNVPGGALLFAPSYYTKDSILKVWRMNNMYDSISQIKPIVEEKSDLPASVIINQFVSHKNGALLVGVCRGKISEGLDFADDLARIVYVFGIPFPGFKDPEVELKMSYNDIRHRTNKNYLSGNDWYNGQAFRALFQSVGRCLRHTSDYGAIIFLDERIETSLNKLPLWLKNEKSLHKSLSVDEAQSLLSDFYKKMKKKFPNNNNNNKNSSYSSLSKNDFNSASSFEGKFSNSYFNSNSNNFIQFSNKDNGAEDVESVTFKKASELHRNDYIKFDLKNEKKMNSKKEFFTQNDDDDDEVHCVEEEEEDYDDDNQKFFLTNLFCASCGSPVIRIKNIDRADFVKISTPEFFQILDLGETKLTVMYIMKSDIQTDFTVSTKLTKWSNSDSCILTRRECSKCNAPLAAYVVSSLESSQYKKGLLLFRTEMLSMQFQGKLTPLCEIATKE